LYVVRKIQTKQQKKSLKAEKNRFAGAMESHCSGRHRNTPKLCSVASVFTTASV